MPNQQAETNHPETNRQPQRIFPSDRCRWQTQSIHNLDHRDHEQNKFGVIHKSSPEHLMAAEASQPGHRSIEKCGLTDDQYGLPVGTVQFKCPGFACSPGFGRKMA